MKSPQPPHPHLHCGEGSAPQPSASVSSAPSSSLGTLSSAPQPSAATTSGPAFPGPRSSSVPTSFGPAFPGPQRSAASSSDPISGNTTSPLLRTAAFTGHRTYRGEADGRLFATLEWLYGQGYRCFLSGMAVGFDLAAAESVERLRRVHADVRLCAVLPFREQSRRFPERERLRWEHLVAVADEVVILSESYHRGCYAHRNRYLVHHSSFVVAWYDGGAGGTGHTVRETRRMGRSLLNLHPASHPASPAPVDLQLF